MICNTIGLTADSFESIYTTGGTEVEEVYGAIDYAQPIYAKTREMTGTSPLTFTSRVAGTLTDYRISGETLQDGTPSPDMPVDVVGVGEKTGNLWDPSSTELERIFEIEPSTSYMVAKYPPLGAALARADLAIYDSDMNLQSQDYAQAWSAISLNGNVNTRYARVKISAIPASVTDPWNYIYFGKGTGNFAPLPFIPYGYKLPITVTNGTDTVTTPVYIGAEPLHRIGEYADYVDYASGTVTRNVKKIMIHSATNMIAENNKQLFVVGIPKKIYTELGGAQNIICESYKYGSNYNNVYQAIRNAPDKSVSSYARSVGFKDSRFTSLEDFNVYLSWSPVTLWYVLATPTTEQITPITIPTTHGINTLSVDTTVKPSQMYIKGKIKPDGYGKLVDKNGVYILDKDGVQLTVHGQGTSNA